MSDPLLRKIQYLHFRFMKDGEINAKGGITICYIPTEEGNSSIGVSVCSPLDQFQKEKSRRQAHDRAIYARHYVSSFKALTFDRLLLFSELQSKAEKLVQTKIDILTEIEINSTNRKISTLLNKRDQWGKIKRDYSVVLHQKTKK